jgi:5-oxoprolinase (ATP-hydrolysing)
MNLHDDRAITKPWGCDGGSPGTRSRKILIQYSKSAANPPRKVLGSKSDHVRVEPDDVLEWVTWGGGGLGDPLTRPPEAVAIDVHRRLVTFEGAAKNYGVIVDRDDFTVCKEETDRLRVEMSANRDSSFTSNIYNRGGTLAQLTESCFEETGLQPLTPQWATKPYGPHVKLPYVQNWYKTMVEKKGWDGL